MGRILRRAVDVFVGAQLSGQRRFVFSSRNRHHVKAHTARELDAQMPEPTDALNGDEVTCAKVRVPQRVVGRDARAKQRGRVLGRQRVGNRDERASLRDDDLGVPAVLGHARCDHVHAVDQIAAPARLAMPAMATEPTDSDTLALFPTRNALADGVDESCDLVTRHVGIRDVRPVPFDDERVGVADASRLDTDPDLPRTGLRNGPLHEAQHSRRRCFYCSVFVGHGNCSSALQRRESQQYVRPYCILSS